ncbi:MAG: ISAs1 family transposase [Myxococcales bacterium]|nr:ISAs1 family transposase [Myxococcales bacterium]
MISSYRVGNFSCQHFRQGHLVSSCIDTVHFDSCFSAWTASIQQPPKTKEDSSRKPVVAIDGKTVRNSGSPGSRPLHLVSAWASETGLTLGQRATEEKSDEITAIPKLIETLDLRGSVVAIDAMGYQKRIGCSSDYDTLSLAGTYEDPNPGVQR